MDYQILFDDDFDAYAWELELKGYFDTNIKFETSIIPISFYDPVRLAQEVESTLVATGIFFERNIVVIPKITRMDIESAIERLNASGGLQSFRENGFNRK
jgi:hypothetical protein